jgi:hypothetical protein
MSPVDVLKILGEFNPIFKLGRLPGAGFIATVSVLKYGLSALYVKVDALNVRIATLSVSGLIYEEGLGITQLSRYATNILFVDSSK